MISLVYIFFSWGISAALIAGYPERKNFGVSAEKSKLISAKRGKKIKNGKNFI
jgi:hypothetical protein